MRRKFARKSLKKRAYRKRVYKKRSYARKYSRPDGYHNIKLVQQIPLRVQIGGAFGDAATLACSWFESSANLITATYWNNYTTAFNWDMSTAAPNPEFVKATQLFTQVKVTGMKIQYEPQYYQSNANKSLYPIQSYSTMLGGTYDTLTLAQVRTQQSLDYKTYDPHKRFTRYYKVNKYLKGLNADSWFDDGMEYAPKDTERSPWTHVRLPVFGFAAGDVVGTATITYYVKLR